MEQIPQVNGQELSPKRSASGAFIFDTTYGKFVFIRRDNIPSIDWPNMIGIVGGGMEDGETPEEACRREIGEELLTSNGAPLQVKNLEKMTEFVNSRGTHIHMHIAEIDDSSQLVIGEEGQEIIRLTPNEMMIAAENEEFADDFNDLIKNIAPHAPLDTF